MSRRPLDAWLTRLETLHPRAMDLGLDRVSAVAARLELIPPAAPVITVAGTNGKGSCIAAMEAVLIAAGHRPGASVSPHLHRFNERIRVGGQPVHDHEITAAFQRIDTARGDISLTYFEFALLASLLVFAARAVDILLLEVGLGGRLDAVNIVDPDVAVITSIALDHQAWLGDTRDAISREKAGILRDGIPAVIADPDPPAALVDCVRERRADAVFIGRDFFVGEGDGVWTGRLRRLQGGQRCLPALPSGPLLPANIAAGLQALLLLGHDFPDATLEATLPALQPGGRRERRSPAGREILLDVAHNPAAAQALADHLRSNPVPGRNLALFSAMADKDIRAIIRACAGVFDGWIVAGQPELARAATTDSIVAQLTATDERLLAVSDTVAEGMVAAGSLAGDADRLVVFGSFHTVAAALAILDD